MKPSERKIKQTVALEGLPAFLRRLADALEKKTDPPAGWSGLAESFNKLTVKGKRRENVWEMKVKLKAGPSSATLPEDPREAQAAGAASAADQPAPPYTDLKKRMKSAYKTIAAAVADRRLPETDTLKAFLADAERMTAFRGSSYGEACYPAFRDACRALSRAFEHRDPQAFAAGYAAVERLKRDCHKTFK
jgi:XXXCH domain-containing protein